MKADTLSSRIFVRHREAGYLRLELPAEICHPAAAEAIEQGLRQVGGVYRVTVFPADRRLAVRYDAHCCDVATVARGLKALLADLPAPPPGVPRVQANRAFAGSLQARLQPVLGNALSEKAVINFLNDLVAFYLIKTHWELISQRWLKDPLKYGNAWLTTFYLVFLLVRYRKTIAKPTPVAAAKP